MGRNLAHWTESYLPERINTCSPCLIAEIKRRNPQGKGEGPECFVAEHVAAGYKEISACLLHNTLLHTKKCHCTDAGEHFYTFFSLCALHSQPFLHPASAWTQESAVKMVRDG